MRTGLALAAFLLLGLGTGTALLTATNSMSCHGTGAVTGPAQTMSMSCRSSGWEAALTVFVATAVLGSLLLLAAAWPRDGAPPSAS